MTLQELRAALRERLDDSAAPYQWSDPTLADYLTRAESEAALRSRLLIDRDTTAICTLTLANGQRNYTLDPRIIEVVRVKVASEIAPLRKTSPAELDANIPYWEDHTGDVILWYTEGKQVSFYRIPGADQAGKTVNLTVIRYPLDPMESDADEPEIPEQYHPYLLFWAEHLAFLNHDVDTYDARKAQAAEEQFERHFGPRPTVNVLTQRKVRHVRRVTGQYI